jgi:hypothetical protein
MLIPRKGKREVWDEQLPDFGSYGVYDDQDQQAKPPSKPEDSLPSIFKPKPADPTAPPPAAPQFELDRHGRPKPPATYSADPTEAIKQKVQYIQALQSYKPENHNRRLTSALITAGRGALQGFAAGGPGGALFGAAAGGIQGAVDPSTDEQYSKQQAIRKARSGIAWDQQQRQLDADYDSAMAENKLKAAQAGNLLDLPERERGRQWEAMRKDLVDVYNSAAEYDPAKQPGFANALKSFGIDAPAKTRAKKTQLVIDQKTGEARVVTTDQTSGAATAAPVMQDEKPLVTTTAPMMAQERQASTQEFQQEQQGRSQGFQREQQQGRQLYGNERFNQRQQQQRQDAQQKLTGNVNGVISGLGLIDSQISQIESKGTPEPGSDDAKQLAGLKKNRALLVQRGASNAAQLNALGDVEAGVGERGFPYIKARPGRQQQSGVRSGVTEQAIRDAAKAKGLDPDKAVQRARARGIL